MNKQIVEPVAHSLSSVLAMARLDAELAATKPKSVELALGDISAVISISGHEMDGTMAVSFHKSVILELAKRMLQSEFPEIDDMVRDLSGEIANMVIGITKAKFERDGVLLDMSMPTVYCGRNHIIRHIPKDDVIVIEFTTEFGSIFVEVAARLH